MEAAPAPGQLLGNRYRLESPLGVSDLAEVYAAVDLHGNRECALKVLPAALRHAPAWDQFQSLARAVAALNVEYVARVYDTGVDLALGRPFIASERVSFPSLANTLVSRGVLSAEQWSGALNAFARALDAAASVGIAHGALKPENLFFSLDQPGWARISDFGGNLLRTPAPGSGSFAWAAPEQIDSGSATRSADVFALGLVTYCVLTGRHYVASAWQQPPNRNAVLDELRAASPERASARALAQGASLRSDLDDWFARALHPDPASRFPTAGEAAAAFERTLTAAPTATSSRVQGVAAAIAAPLLFQDLPRPAPAPAPAQEANATRLAVAPPTVAPAPALAAAASIAPLPALEPVRSSSRPPGYAAPRASSTEHIPGLPPRPPIAVFAAVGVFGLLFISLAAFGLIRLLLPAKPPAAALRTEPPRVAPAPGDKTSAPALSASSALSSGSRAHFECVPEDCEWIVCDGENVKRGVLELALAPGKHSCSGSRYGFRTAVTEFVVTEEHVTNVRLELMPAKAASAASTKAVPHKAVAPKKLGAKSTTKTPKASKANTGAH